MHYPYIAENEEQYDSSTFQEGRGVVARYRHAENEFDAGNPFIESLPLPRSKTEAIQAYSKPINGFTVLRNDETKLRQIPLLRQLRLPLPFHYELEEECYNAIVTSYRARHIMRDPDVDLKYMQRNQENKTNQILVGSLASGTDAGFHMLGYSGCGKSSSLQVLFSNYPQYISHEGPDGTRFPQITYLVVTCQPNSNFNALYESVGAAIDRALGNITPVYEREVAKARGLAGKAQIVRRLIEFFSVGIIVFDEIQLIDFESTRENSFEGLMTLANQTKVAMAVVGTEDAYGKMFTTLRTSRRLGAEIHASSYCDDRNYFDFLVTQVFRYQWFDEEVIPDIALIDALYKYSAGIVDQLIGIYMYMNIDYIKARVKPKITPSFVKNVVEKHYPGIQAVLADMSNPLNEVKRASIVRTANEEMAKVLDAESQKQFGNMVTETFNDVSAEQNRVSAAVQAIQSVTDAYSTKTIEKEAESVLKTKAASKMSQTELNRKIMERLQNKTSDKRPGAKKAPKELDAKHLAMKNFIETK